MHEIVRIDSRLPMFLSDTTEAAASTQLDLLRRRSTAERLAIAINLSRATMALSKRAIRRANPNASEEELKCLFVEYHYGQELADRLRDYMAVHSR
jgi:hypothetical protein